MALSDLELPFLTDLHTYVVTLVPKTRLRTWVSVPYLMAVGQAVM